MFRIQLVLIFFLLFSTSKLSAQLSGTYTIGSGGDYSTFSAAVSALTNDGVSSAVTFEVLTGNYSEQVVIPAISGASASNTITFQAQSGNAGDVILSYTATGSGDNYVVRMDASSYITVNNLTLSAFGAAYARVVEILNASHHITMSNVVLNGNASATSSGSQYLVTANNTVITNLLFDNCTFNEGSIGVYLQGFNGSNLSGSNIIQNSTFNSVGYYSVYAQYQNNIQLTDNEVIAGDNGFYLQTCQGEQKILRNIINCKDYGLNIYSCTGGSNLVTDPGLIANNMITASNNYGAYIYNSNYQNFYHNSINMTSGNANTVGFYIYSGGNNNVVNNSFAHMGYGVAAQVQSASSVNELDYNNYFSNGNYLVEWGTDGIYNLADFQSASGKDVHSVSVYPGYTSNSDLHTMTPWLDGKGTFLGDVAQDYDGENRDGSTPDIGADEFTPDAANTTPLAGHYTVGGSSPDYATLADALSDLLVKGVSDSVFLDFRNGNYSIRQTIYTIPGSSMDAPVVMQSESGNHDNVILYNYATDANDNYILHLHGADFIHFRNLGFSGNTDNSAYSRNIALTGGVNHFKMEGCKLNGSQNSSTYAALLSGQTALYNSRLIEGNIFNGGGFGIYTSGINSNTRSMNAVIKNNEFNDQRNYALQVQYEDDINVTDNMVSAPSGNGIYLHTCNGEIRVLRNMVQTSSYGLNIYSCTGGSNLANGPGLIANNMVYSSNNYGLYSYNNSNQNFYHNSVNMTSSNTNTVGFYIYSGGNNNVVNNSFVHMGYGVAAQIQSASALNELDYNNYFSNGNYLVEWGTSGVYDLAEFQSNSSKDAHSVSVYPGYSSNTDLHSMSPWLDGKGTYVSDVTQDFDGENRDGSTPDIGADEFTPDAANTTPMAGHYTVGGSNPDYATLADAVSDLLIKGVSDSVFLDFRNGNYNVRQTFYSIPGTGTEAPVILQAESGNRENVTLYYYATDANDNYVIHVHGADYIHFRHIGFSGNTDNSAYSRNIALTGGVNHFKVEDCVLNGSQNSSTYAALISAQSVLYTSRLIEGNAFNGGGFGIYSSGINNNFRSMNAVITNNEFNDQRNYALQIQYEDDVMVTDNMVSAPSGNGVYLHTCQGEIRVLRNEIQSSGYGMNLYSCAGGNDLETGPGLIANNMINATNNYGAYLYNCSFQNFYHNSINMTSGNANTVGFYIYSGSGNNIVNNSFVHMGYGVAAQIQTASAVNEMDYNNYFSNGNYLVEWGTDGVYDLADFQSNSGKDVHSVSVYPGYNSSSDLHTMSPWLDGKGINLSEVTQDFDGESRDGSTPDIGADEFTPDAATTTPMAGHYTVGGSTPDYATLTDAVSDLQVKGVSDTVFLDFRNGNYNIRETLYSFPGTGMEAPVILQSETGNRDNVTLYYYATDANDNYILHLHGADFIHFRDLGFAGNTDNSAYSRNIALTGGVNHFKLENCKLTGSQNSSTYAALISGQTVLYKSRLIDGNVFNGGGFGIYTSGINGNYRSMNAVISNNEFQNQRNYAVQVQYEDDISIMDNMVNAPSGNGMYLHTCNGEIEVLKNKIYSNSYGLNLYSCNGGSDLESVPGLVANNFVTSNNNYSAYLYSSSNQNFYNNSVNLTGGNANSTAFYINAGGNNNIVNNILVNSNVGYAYYVISAASIGVSDYNDIFTNGTNVGYWGANKATLADFQAASSKDANSISVDPQFVSATDLHVTAEEIDSVATPLTEVTTDIDGEMRDATFPDIGADEFIFGYNYAPEITSEPDTSAVITHKYEYQVVASDKNGDELSYNLTTAPTFLSVDAMGMISGTPSSGDIGEHTVVVEVTDGNGGSVTQTFTLHVEMNVGLDDVNSGSPSTFMLYQNYPNPFSNLTFIKYDLPTAGHVKLEVYDINGRMIEQLVNNRQDAGSYAIPFNAEDLTEGLYFYRISAGTFSAVQKMVLNR
ncbi:right-handed parallel beta-helix repeat-containing protein [Saccharicrinis sp. FJH54]|uniref:right-handed parallel beta-helix repeat-containing protein n=1 Tax=Saccharicrinis sp. FJH54 TaxID=3344665 RepID=UPI0035D4DFD0